MDKAVRTALMLIVLAASWKAAGWPQKASGRLLWRPPEALRQLRFSPDGHYVLAQDYSTVAVLTVQPFRVALRAAAEDAGLAEFTPDSHNVVFVAADPAVASARHHQVAGRAPRVERWSIAQRARSDFTPVVLRSGETDTLSPDGRVLACIDTAGTFRLLDVATGQTIFQKRKFAKTWVIWIEKPTDPLDQFPRHEEGNIGSARIDFSPDGRFVIAVPDEARGSPIAWDLHERKTLNLTGPLRGLRWGVMFSFVAADQILVSAATFNHVALWKEVLLTTLVELPSGRQLWKTTSFPCLKPSLPPMPMFRAADSQFVILRPQDEQMIFSEGAMPATPPDTSAEVVVRDPKVAAAAVEYRTGQMIVSRTSALDVFGDHYIAERANGEIGLYERGKPAAVAAIRLEGH